MDWDDQTKSYEKDGKRNKGCRSVDVPQTESVSPEEKECRKAAEKAMNLLLQQDRTKKELQDRLYRAGFSEKASLYAMEYVTGFGYIDDMRYARNYISYHKGNRSRKELRYKLLNKGIEADVLAVALEEYETEDEREALIRLIRKRLHGRSLTELDYNERNKLTAYLARKGFSLPAIRRVMQEQEL